MATRHQKSPHNTKVEETIFNNLIKMKFDIEKPKTRKGLSYVLKTSMLKDILDANNIDCNIHLIYWTPRNIPIGETILECHYWLPNKNVDYDRFYIRAGTVKSESRKVAEKLMKEQVLPKFIDWILHIKSLPATSTLLENKYFNAVFKNDKVTIYQ